MRSRFSLVLTAAALFGCALTPEQSTLLKLQPPGVAMKPCTVLSPPDICTVQGVAISREGGFMASEFYMYECAGEE